MWIIIFILSAFIIISLYDFLSKRVKDKKKFKKIYKTFTIAFFVSMLLYVFLKDLLKAKNIYEIYSIIFTVSAALLTTALFVVISKNADKDLSSKKSFAIYALIACIFIFSTLGLFFRIEAEQKALDQLNISIDSKNYLK